MQSYRPEWVEPKAMKALGYSLVSDKEGYLKYQNDGGTRCPGYGLMPQGKRQVFFNTTYNPANSEVFVGIREDWDTRNVYYGVCNTEIAFRLIIGSVR
jgi:hypothetical protein